MKRMLAVSAVVAMLVGVLLAVITSHPSGAQTGDQSTIAALQTRVAELEGTVKARGRKINAQRTQIAELKNPAPTEVPQSDAGQTVEVDGWRITFVETTLSETAGERSNTETAAGIYLIVNYVLENTTNAPAEFPYLDLVVVDSEGRRFSSDHDATFFYGAAVLDFYPTDPYQPGIEYNVATVFDVPDRASGFVLTTTEEVFEITLDR